MINKELIKGSLKPIILTLLKDNNRMYGYEITQRVKEITKDQIQITEGALYPLLHKLEADGIVQTEVENIGKRVRKYYKLTESGTSIANKAIDEISAFIEVLKDIVENNKPALSYGSIN